jgi:SAM-dependent methyltransferase
MPPSRTPTGHVVHGGVPTEHVQLDDGDHCRWCGSRDLATLRERGEHRVLRCRRCGFLTLKTGIDESQLFDSYQDYLPLDMAAIVRWEREQRPVIARAVREIGRLAPGCRLLEVGAGFGFFLARARAAGFDVHGLEFSATGRRYARERFGLELSDESLERVSSAGPCFDVVCAFYLVEHLSDPRTFLHQAARALRPGGLLFLRWPHTTPLVRLLDAFGIRHDLYHAPWHLSDFTPATMERAFAETGFERIATRTFGGTAVFGPLGALGSRGAAALSELLEVASGARLSLPGLTKTTFGFTPAAAPAVTPRTPA